MKKAHIAAAERLVYSEFLVFDKGGPITNGKTKARFFVCVFLISIALSIFKKSKKSPVSFAPLKIPSRFATLVHFIG